MGRSRSVHAFRTGIVPDSEIPMTTLSPVRKALLSLALIATASAATGCKPVRVAVTKALVHKVSTDAQQDQRWQQIQKRQMEHQLRVRPTRFRSHRPA